MVNTQYKLYFLYITSPNHSFLLSRTEGFLQEEPKEAPSGHDPLTDDYKSTVLPIELQGHIRGFYIASRFNRITFVRRLPFHSAKYAVHTMGFEPMCSIRTVAVSDYIARE